MLTDAAFLAAPKRLQRDRIRWRRKGHHDYVEVRIGVEVIGDPREQGRVIFQSHLTMQPVKYTFTLLRHADRIFGLDVNPNRPHTNPVTLQTIWGTHWQMLPDLRVAVPDARELSHRQWLDEFLRRANILRTLWYNEPPRGEQLSLDL
jgi:hypothetical protein